MKMIKLQTLWIELYKFTRTHTTVQLSHFLTNVWKSFMSLSHKELLNRQEAIDAMTWRRLKHLSNISPCNLSPGSLHMGPRANVTQSLNQAQDSLIGSQACYQRANQPPIPHWHFLPSMAFTTALNFFDVLSIHRWFDIVTSILNNESAVGKVNFGFRWYTCCTTSWKLENSWPLLSFEFF